MKRLKLIALPFSFALLFSQLGCANLEAIREFASISSESAQYTHLVDDYAQSPSRQKSFQPAGMGERLDKMAAEREAQRPELLALHTLISEYMDSLGQLAADDLVVFDSEIDLLGKELADRKILSSRQGDAYAEIARLLTTMAADRWRKRQLKKLIEKSNADFQIVTGALKDIVRKDFRRSIENEEIAAAKYYDGKIAEAKATPPQQAGIAALEELRDKRVAGIHSKIEAVDAYTEILEKIAQGHQTLYDQRNALSRKDLIQEVKRDSKTLRKLYKKLREL